MYGNASYLDVDGRAMLGAVPPAAKMGDKVVAVDTHIIMIPSPGGPVPTPTPMPFNGTDVMIENKPAAVVGSKAMNIAPHIPTGGPFQKPSTNRGTIIKGSAAVLINNKPAARAGDKVMTCNDPAGPQCPLDSGIPDLWDSAPASRRYRPGDHPVRPADRRAAGQSVQDSSINSRSHRTAIRHRAFAWCSVRPDRVRA